MREKDEWEQSGTLFSVYCDRNDSDISNQERIYIAALVKIKCLLSPPAHVSASLIPTGAQTYVSGITDINI